MQNLPLVSICIPTYNNIEEVKRLVDSVLEQTYTNWELVITDDSDDTVIGEYLVLKEKECSGLAGKYSYRHNHPKKGHIYNWNACIELAKGELIKIMFSDDWFTFENSLERMVNALVAQPDAALVFTGSRQVSAQKSWDRAASDVYLKELKQDYRTLFLGNEIGAPSATMYRANLNVRFDERSNWASDVFLYFEILRQNETFVCLQEPLISIGIHEAQYTELFTERDERKYGDYRLLYEKYALKESIPCRERMLLWNLQYKKGKSQCLVCGASAGEYYKAALLYFWNNTILGYWNGLLHKLKGKSKSL